MYMFDSVYIFLYNFQRIFSTVCKMACIKKKAYIFRICILHHTVNFLKALYDSSHMMMEGKCNTILFLCNLTKLVHACAKCIPLFIIHYIFMAEDRSIQLSLNAVALLGSTDHLRSHSFQKCKLCTELFLYLLKWFCDKEA